MKKIDTSKPAIHKEWGSPAEFKFDFLDIGLRRDDTKRKTDRVLVWLCEFVNGFGEPTGGRYVRETDEFGRMPNGNHIVVIDDWE